MKLRSTALAALSLLVVAVPTAAQDPTSSSVLFDGMGFTFDQSIGSSVNVTQVPGESPEPTAFGAPDSPHLTFSVYGPRAEFAKMPRVGGTGTAVHFFPVADQAPYKDALDELDRLQAILAARPDPAGLATGGDALPYMPPVVDAAQMLRARVSYVDLPGLQGISYLTAYGQDAYPFTSDRFQYVFEGLSTDGRWYVAAIFDVTTDLFPKKVSAKDANRIVATRKAYERYEAESRATLEGAAQDAFAPTLDAADALIASIVIEGVPVAGPAADPVPAPSASPAA